MSNEHETTSAETGAQRSEGEAASSIGRRARTLLCSNDHQEGMLKLQWWHGAECTSEHKAGSQSLEIVVFGAA
jgi:hypothetical protein